MSTRYVALLRAVNLAGRNQVSMQKLRDLVTELGLVEARTLLQSGNIVFGCAERKSADMESLLETEVARRLNVATDFFVRTAAEWRAIVSGNRFVEEAERDPGHLLVMALKKKVTPGAVQQLQEAITGRELVRGAGRHIYVLYPDGIGRSRLTTAVIEQRLGTRATGRNWNTVLKLQDLLESLVTRD